MRFIYPLLIPGVLTLVVSLYPLLYAYRQIVWTRTEGLFIDQIISEDGQTSYSLLEFEDSNGVMHQAKIDYDDTMMEGSDNKHFVLYYDPKDPSRYVPLNYGLYLMLLFSPFGWLLCYLGIDLRKPSMR